MSSSLTPYMNLIVPGVGSEQGPIYALDINASLTLIDSHDHSPGRGVQLTPNGLNINSDLPINSNNLTVVRSVRFVNQSSPFTSLPADIGALFEIGGDFYYINSAGVQVQITSGSSIVGTAGSITGLPSGTASASYAAGTFVWQSATSTPANMDAGSYIFRNNVANSKGLTLNPPNSMVADYSLVLPIVPGVTSFMTLDTSGNMAAPTPYPLTTPGITNLAVTNAKLALLGQVVSSNFTLNNSFNSGSYTDVPNSTTAALTILGTRPIEIRLCPIGLGNLSFIKVSDNGTYNIMIVANSAGSGDVDCGEFQVGVGGTVDTFITSQGTGSISNQGYNSNSGPSFPNVGITAGANSGITTTSNLHPTFQTSPSIINTAMIGLSAGAYTFRLQYGNGSSSAALSIFNCKLVAYEL